MWPKSNKIARQATVQLEEQISNTSLLKEESDTSSLGGPSPEAKLGLWQALGRFPRITLYSLMLTSTIILWGYDTSVVGGVSSMPEFQKVFGVAEGDRWIIPSNWLAIWHVGAPLGTMAGSVIAGWLGDIIGRRWMLCSSTLLSAGAVMLCLIADTPADIGGRRGLFLVAKSIQGVAIGAITTITQTYMSEVVPQQLRSSILPFFPIFQLVGQIIGSIVVQIQMEMEGKNSYRITFATQWAFSIMPLIVSVIIPESPTWLLRKKHVERARKAHQRLEHNKKNPRAHMFTFEQLQKTVAHEQAKSGENVKYIDCFKGTDLRRTGLVILMNLLPDWFGLSLLGNAGYFLQQVGQDAKTANLFFIVGIALGLAGNVSTFFVLARFGRRKIVLITLSIITVLWLAISLAGTINKQSSATIWFTCVTMMLIVFTAGVGVWPASYVIAAETSSLRLRARTQGVGWTVNGVAGVAFGMSMPYVYNADAGDLGGMSGYIFVAFSALAVAICFFCLPEMKGRNAADIDRMFELELPARQFKGWHRDVGSGAVKRVDSMSSADTTYRGGYDRLREEEEAQR